MNDDALSKWMSEQQIQAALARSQDKIIGGMRSARQRPLGRRAADDVAMIVNEMLYLSVPALGR